MTDNLRQQVARLRDLSPRLNEVTDQAARVVLAVEKFLNDECSIGIPARVRYKSVQDDDGCQEDFWLNYDRFQGKFRLYVSEATVIQGNVDHTEETAWASCRRDVKLASFQAIPQLLQAISDQVERAIQETDGASKTIADLLRAMGGHR